MQYLIVLSPILLLFLSKSVFKRSICSSKSIIDLIEGRDHIRLKSNELYKLGELLMKLRSLYGPKINLSLKKLKSEVSQQRREIKKIKELRYSAFYQQGVMIGLISIMIYISSSMFSEVKIPLPELVLLQFISISLVIIVEKILFQKLIAPVTTRFKYLLILNCLSGSSLSVSKILTLIDWDIILSSQNGRNIAWDLSFKKSIQEWKLTGSGLDDKLKELEIDLEFIKETENKRYRDFVEVSKFISLIISGFFSYFLYLFSLMNSFLS